MNNIKNIKLEGLAKAVKVLLGEDYIVESGINPKNNEEVMYVSIRREGENILPLMYVAEQDLENVPTEELARAIVDRYYSLPKTPRFELSFATDLEAARDKIYYRMVSANNAAYLEGKVYEEYLDLAKVYYVRLDEGASVVVNEGMLANWGVSKEEIIAIGNENMLNSKYEVIDMANVYIKAMMAAGASREEAESNVELMLEEADAKMVILRYENNISGASVILNKPALRECSNLIGGDYIIIPSSTMEVIAVPADIDATEEAILEMVEQVNATVVEAQDVLSNSVYRYNAETEEVTLIATRKVEEVA